MKLLVLFVCLCLALANAKPFVTTPFVYFNPTQYTVPGYQYPINTPQVIPTFRTATNIPVPAYPFVFNRFHTQDPNGAYTFSYSGGPSSRTESRDQFGNVVGAFNYIDPKGKIQTQQYVADSRGFRVAGTNLPIEPVVNIKEDKTTFRTKRDTTKIGKTPASTVPLNTFDVNNVVPQTFTNRVVSPIVPNFFTINRNVVPNLYTVPQVPGTTFPFTVYPYNAYPYNTAYSVPTPSDKTTTFPFQPITYTGVNNAAVFPFNPNFFTGPIKTPTDKAAVTKVENVPFQPTVYSGVNNAVFPFNPNFYTTDFKTIKTPGRGFTYYY